jgi:hypothetical protein
MAAKLTRLTHKIAIQLHLVAESCTVCISRSRRSVPKLLDTPSYIHDLQYIRFVNFVQRTCNEQSNGDGSDWCSFTARCGVLTEDVYREVNTRTVGWASGGWTGGGGWCLETWGKALSHIVYGGLKSIGQGQKGWKLATLDVTCFKVYILEGKKHAGNSDMNLLLFISIKQDVK